MARKTTKVDVFRGIAPRFENNLKEGFAVDAENIDISSDKIKPLKENEIIVNQTDTEALIGA